MAAGDVIRRLVTSFGVDFDKSSADKVDKAIKNLEARFRELADEVRNSDDALSDEAKASRTAADAAAAAAAQTDKATRAAAKNTKATKRRTRATKESAGASGEAADAERDQTEALKESSQARDDAIMGTARLVRNMAAVTAGVHAASSAYHALRAAVDVVVSVGEETRETAEFAEALGFTVREFSALSGGFEQAGRDTTDLVDAIATVADRAKDAEQGTKSMLEDFALVGLTVDDLRGKRPAELFRTFADAVAATSDDTTRMTSIVRILGDDVGRRFAPLLMRGSVGLDEMAAGAERAGLALSDADALMAERLTDSTRRLTADLEGLRFAAAMQAAPAVESVARALANTLEASRSLDDEPVPGFFAQLAADAEGAVSPLEFMLRAALRLAAALEHLGTVTADTLDGLDPLTNALNISGNLVTGQITRRLEMFEALALGVAGGLPGDPSTGGYTIPDERQSRTGSAETVPSRNVTVGQINVVGSPVGDPDETAAAVRREIDSMMRGASDTAGGTL